MRACLSPVKLHDGNYVINFFTPKETPWRSCRWSRHQDRRYEMYKRYNCYRPYLDDFPRLSIFYLKPLMIYESSLGSKFMGSVCSKNPLSSPSKNKKKVKYPWPAVKSSHQLFEVVLAKCPRLELREMDKLLTSSLFNLIIVCHTWEMDGGI